MRFKTYRELILTATTEKEVTRVLFDAVGQIGPEELGSLPEECVRAVGNHHMDIHEAAVDLLHCDLKHRAEQGIGELLRQLAELYASASVRLSSIQHRFPGE